MFFDLRDGVLRTPPIQEIAKSDPSDPVIFLGKMPDLLGSWTRTVDTLCGATRTLAVGD
jgi:hypothetical protein